MKASKVKQLGIYFISFVLLSCEAKREEPNLGSSVSYYSSDENITYSMIELNGIVYVSRSPLNIGDGKINGQVYSSLPNDSKLYFLMHAKWQEISTNQEVDALLRTYPKKIVEIIKDSTVSVR